MSDHRTFRLYPQQSENVTLDPKVPATMKLPPARHRRNLLTIFAVTTTPGANIITIAGDPMVTINGDQLVLIS